jgi:hypothetical protein
MFHLRSIGQRVVNTTTTTTTTTPPYYSTVWSITDNTSNTSIQDSAVIDSASITSISAQAAQGDFAVADIYVFSKAAPFNSGTDISVSVTDGGYAKIAAPDGSWIRIAVSVEQTRPSQQIQVTLGGQPPASSGGEKGGGGSTTPSSDSGIDGAK